MYDRDLPSNGGTNDGSHQGEEEEPLHGREKVLSPPRSCSKTKNSRVPLAPDLLSAVDCQRLTKCAGEVIYSPKPAVLRQREMAMVTRDPSTWAMEDV